MTAFVPQLKLVLRGLWQGRWVGLVVAWIAGIAGATFVFMTPDRYEASARVYVDTQSVLQPLMAGLALRPNVEQEVMLLTRTLISRPNMQKLVRMADLDLHVRTADEREKLIDELMKRLSIRSVGQANLYTISFAHTDRTVANRVVQALLSLFVESGLTGKANDTGQARRFIEEQIKAYEQRLIEAENRVKEFKLRNMDLNGGTDFFTSLNTVAEGLRQARLQLQEAQTSRDAIKQQIAEEETRASAPANGAPPVEAPAAATPELDARIGTLAKNLDEMLLRYTDNHPDVINTRRIIKEVEAQRDEERKRFRSATGAPAGTGSPVYAPLKMALTEAEAQVAGLRARVADFERRHAALMEKARSIPEREAEFTQLNRDYGVQKQQYDNLVARRETATISSEVSAATGFADFRIIDPPRVSPTPVAPNRALLVPLVLLASLGAGLALAYLFSVIHPTFHESRALKRIGQRPVLGAVSLVMNDDIAKKLRRGRVLFFSGVGGLAATYCGAVAATFLRTLLPF